MTEIVIRNQNILKRLNGFIDTFFQIEGYNDPKYRLFSSEEDIEKAEYYCSREWLDHMLQNADTHVGFPDQHMAQPISKMVQEDSAKFLDFRNEVKDDFTKEIGAMSSALLNYYPPGGFVGWHTNWNANCYTVLFTWSKSGNGYFKYYDKANDEVITIQDVPGWQCRAFYFGRMDEPDHHCWHSAYAGEDRITLAYKFTNNSLKDPSDATARMLRDQLIEEIESEE